eukprot:TRINITY_DN103319_c0_g1_i1.p1 TRINITY_DN103319_c0_g1~~TRINITY_DN103319_c0_g1_i1.p1  ORF type:complete len:610 (-),score=157.61 TRINITY_DN103319_c0_g1_i1:120-1949(-)
MAPSSAANAASTEKLAAIKKLEKTLTGAEGSKHLNDVAQFYEFAESQDLRIVAEALKALPRILAHHRYGVNSRAREGKPHSADDELSEWLKGHQDAYHAALAQLAASKSAKAQVCGVRLFMAALQEEDSEARSLTGTRGAGAFQPDMRIRNFMMEVALSDDWSGHAADCLMGEYAGRYADIRHHVMHCLRANALEAGKAGLIRSSASTDAAEPPAKKQKQQLTPFGELMRERKVTPEALFARTLAFLKEAPTPDLVAPPPKAAGGEEEAIEDVDLLAPAGRPASTFVNEYKKVFQNAWLQLLGLRVPMDQCQPLLQLVPNSVMPHMTQPLMLADFYIQAFNAKSTAVAVTALSGLFLLLTRFGLGDPDALSGSAGEFYGRLFSLLAADTFQLKQRTRFQRLLATSLMSGLMPARYAAAFAKKCMRLAVSVTEHGTVMWLISVAYSLIQKHHSHCKTLLHRPAEETADADDEDEVALAEEVSGKKAASDAFDMSAPLPKAVEQVTKSSLWELQLLRQHHVPAISTLAKLFLKPFFRPTARKLDPDSFLDQTPVQMYAQALKAGDRQVERWKNKGTDFPMAFKLEDDTLAARLVGWAAGLATNQRKVGADI